MKHELIGLSGQLKDDASALIEQKPNSRPLGIFLGTPLKVIVPPFTHLAHTYQLGKNGTFFSRGYDVEHVRVKRDSLRSKFEKKIADATKDKRRSKLRNRMVKKLDKQERKIKEGNQFMRWGEELAVYDESKAKATMEKINIFLNSKGFFNSRIEIDTNQVNKKKRTVELTYNVQPGPHFVIDSIQYIIPDTALKALVLENISKAPLRKGFYDQENFAKERDHIYNLAVNNGYFDFSKQFISFEIDSTQLGQDTLFVREIIRNPEGSDTHKIFYLDSIIFISDASLTQAYNRTNEEFKGMTFSFGKNRYSKKILQWRIPLEQDDRYSRARTIETQRQLSYLDNFKFVNINYDTTGRRFVANIFTSPFDRYQTSSEFGIVQNTNSPRLGPFFNVSLKNRNTFRALEIISFDVNAKVEGINDVTGEQESNYSSRQYGGELSFSFPQFLFPLGKFYKKKIGRFNPKTRLSFGLGFEDRVNEYTRRTIKTSLSYSWQVRDQLKHTLTPLQVSFIRSDNTQNFEGFLTQLENDGNTYANAFRSAFVSSTSYQLELSLGDYRVGKDGGYVRFFVEAGGNLNNIFGENAFGDSIETYQFVKANIDLRKIEKVTRKLNIAYRLNIGYALAYGANNSLPYEKYFFAGGSNSIRAWKPRRLGPGAFGKLQEGSTETDFTREQPGDLLIESSFEFRQKLVGFLEGAFFVDAGNVWLVRGSSVNPSEDPELDDGRFRFSDFMDEMAVGTGFGFRFDLSFLILRLDLGLKLFDPAKPKGNRFVGDEIFTNFGPNSELNIGIGYPF